jgi:glycosyltransferase involved in cell wall biosynthesis
MCSLGLPDVRVLIDTTYDARAPFSGTGVYIDRLCRELVRAGNVEVIAVANERRRPPAGGGLGSVRNLAADAWWTAVELPRLASENRAELIHHPLPALAPKSAVPQVITVADLAFERLPDCFDRRYRTYARVMHRAAARRASAVICVSETTASDVRELWSVSQGRIAVALHGPGQELEPPPTKRAEPTHFLYVGDGEPRKDLPTLLEAYQRYRVAADRPLELVLAGSARAAAPGVRTEQHPRPARLAELYAGAAALIHPSLYEGFGLTPLEAMRLGTPVLAARSPGVQEVCADAIAYAPAGDAQAFAAQMREIASDASLRERLHERGLRRAEHFSWRKCARAHLEAYSLALGA